MSLLLLNLLDTSLQIRMPELLGIHGGNEQGRLLEENTHLLEGSPGSLGKECPKEDGIGEVANLGDV